jgi:hypothetical protein
MKGVGLAPSPFLYPSGRAAVALAEAEGIILSCQSLLAP